MDYKQKYLKYKLKYLNLVWILQQGGAGNNIECKQNYFVLPREEYACGIEIGDIVTEVITDAPTKTFKTDQAYSYFYNDRNNNIIKQDFPPQNTDIYYYSKNSPNLQDKINQWTREEETVDLDRGTGLKKTQTRYSTGSNYFFIYLNRIWYGNKNKIGARYQPGKHQVNIPEKLIIPLKDGYKQEYELISFIVHHGGSRPGSANTSGHYSCYVKKSVNGTKKWYHCNDTSISEPLDFDNEKLQLDLKGSVLTSSASSMLLYKKPKVELQKGRPIGLKNLGGTCYMNSFVQFMWTTDIFNKLDINFPKPNAMNLEVKLAKIFQFNIAKEWFGSSNVLNRIEQRDPDNLLINTLQIYIEKYKVRENLNSYIEEDFVEGGDKVTIDSFARLSLTL
jgi:hypothetical protein